MMAANADQEKIAALAPWFHNIHLPSGEQTAPDHFLGDFPAFKWEVMAPLLPEDLSGARVLDIGCNAGFYSVQLARRGAQVLGIDVDPHYLRQAEWVVREFGLEKAIEFRQMQVYDLKDLHGQFDIVIFMGVFYHLRYPLLALDIIAEKVKGQLVFQTLTLPGDALWEQTEDRPLQEREVLLEEGWPKMAFIENYFSKDPTNWWVANTAGVEAMLRSAGLRITEHPEKEIYFCEPAAHFDDAYLRRHIESQRDAALGRAQSGP